MKRLVYLVVLALALTAAVFPQQKKAATAPSQKSGAAAKSAAKSQPAPGPVIDINSASEQELKTLPGIGDAYSAKIVQNRPYRAKNQLVQKKVVPQATYDKIKDMIIAKQGADTKK